MGFFGGLVSGISDSGAVQSATSKRKGKSHHKTADQDVSAGIGDDSPANPAMAHKGAKIRKSGKIRVLKGERVLSKKQAKKYAKKMRGKK